MSMNSKISLSKELESFRCDRPSEWKMDDFIEKALKLEADINKANEQAEHFEREMYLLEDARDAIADKFKEIQSERNMLNGFVLELLSLIYNSAEGEICMGYTADIEGIAQSAFSITSLDSTKVREALRNERRNGSDQ